MFYINIIHYFIFFILSTLYEINNKKGNNAPTTHQYIFFTIIIKKNFDPIQIHLHVARVDEPALNNNNKSHTKIIIHSCIYKVITKKTRYTSI